MAWFLFCVNQSFSLILYPAKSILWQLNLTVSVALK